MKRLVLPPLFILILLSLWGIHGCLISHPIKGTAFTVDEKGVTHPISGGRITVYRGDLPEKLGKSFPWCDESILLRTSQETANIADRTDDLLVISFISDSLLDRRVDLKSWCLRKIDKYNGSIDEYDREMKALTEEHNGFAKAAAKNRAIHEKNKKLAAGYENKAEASKRMAQQKRDEAETALREAEIEMENYRQKNRMAWTWLNDAHDEINSYYGSTYLATRYLDHAQNEQQSAESSRLAGLGKVAWSKRCLAESQKYTELAGQQQEKSEQCKLAAEEYRQMFKVNELIANDYVARIKEFEKKVQDCKKADNDFHDICEKLDKNYHTGDFASLIYLTTPSSLVLHKLHEACGIATMDKLPQWYETSCNTIDELMKESIIAQGSTGSDGSFNLRNVSGNSVYLVIIPSSAKAEFIAMQRIDRKNSMEDLVISNDFVYEVKDWGVLRNGLSFLRE